jgi:hypothetical protein
MDLMCTGDGLVSPVIQISDCVTAFQPDREPPPRLCTPPCDYAPEAFFGEPTTMATDIWNFGVGLYEVLGDRTLFLSMEEQCDHHDAVADMVNALGRLPRRWWDGWPKRWSISTTTVSGGGSAPSAATGPCSGDCTSACGKWTAGRYPRHVSGMSTGARCARWRHAEGHAGV